MGHILTFVNMNMNKQTPIKSPLVDATCLLATTLTLTDGFTVPNSLPSHVCCDRPMKQLYFYEEPEQHSSKDVKKYPVGITDPPTCRSIYKAKHSRS